MTNVILILLAQDRERVEASPILGMRMGGKLDESHKPLRQLWAERKTLKEPKMHIRL